MDLMNWDVDDRMAMIHQPLLMIAGDVSDTRYMTDDAFKKATGTRIKNFIWLRALSTLKLTGSRNTSMKKLPSFRNSSASI